MRKFVAVLLAATVLFVLAQPAGAAVKRKVGFDCVHFAVKPSYIILACGDGKAWVDGGPGTQNPIRWKWWAKTAFGEGRYVWYQNGGWHKKPMHVTLSHPRKCSSGLRTFRRMAVRWGKQYQHVFRIGTWPQCP